MIKSTLADITLLLKFFFSPVLFGQLHGWKLISLYVVSVMLSAGISYIIIDEELDRLLSRSEARLAQTNKEKQKKSNVAKDYRRVQTQFDETVLKQGSCVNKLNPDSAAWKECVSADMVWARLKKYQEDNTKLLRPFEDVDYSLMLLSAYLSGIDGIGHVNYSAISANDEDVLLALVLKLQFTSSTTALVDIFQSINAGCANCKVQLIELKPTDNDALKVSLRVSLYLLADDKPVNTLQELNQAIADNKYSGDDLKSLASNH